MEGMERKTETVDVKEAIGVVESSVKRSHFIKRKGVDPDAAYERIKIIRKHKREMLAEINETNTTDIVGEHAHHFDDAILSLDLLVLDDLTIIHQGE